MPPPPPMAPTLFELNLNISSAKDLKNVNWRHGSLKPSVSAWVEPNAKSSTKVDSDGDTSPSWNETLHIPVTSSIDDSALYLEIVHHKSDGEDDTKPIVGSARLSLRDVVDDGSDSFRSLELRRPSGRPQGKIDVEISVKDLLHRPADQYHAVASPYAAAAIPYAAPAAYAAAAPYAAPAAYAAAAPYAVAAPYSATPLAYSAVISARNFPHAPSVYAYEEPTIGQEASYVQINAAADETGLTDKQHR